MTGQREHEAYPEYVENEWDTMWVRRDRADSPAGAVVWLNRELGIGLPDEAAEGVREVRMRLYPPDHPDAPMEARSEGADYLKVEEDGPVPFWQVSL